MVDRLAGEGVLFAAKPPYVPHADAGGTAHRPWNKLPFKAMSKATRRFPPIPEHPSIAQRMQASPVLADPEDRMPGPYTPENRP